jgi:6-pyruvoyltetrahydropterin/6-carboxytetrahydropterin synthase
VYSIKKRFSFSAAHYLQGLPPTHPCSQLHGHNYEVEIEVQTADVDRVGFVIDYRSLDGLKKMLDSQLDHQCLNDVVKFNPTAENVAFMLWHTAHDALDLMMRDKHDYYRLIIHVSETPKTWASYDGEST